MNVSLASLRFHSFQSLGLETRSLTKRATKVLSCLRASRVLIACIHSAEPDGRTDSA